MLPDQQEPPSTLTTVKLIQEMPHLGQEMLKQELLILELAIQLLMDQPTTMEQLKMLIMPEAQFQPKMLSQTIDNMFPQFLEELKPVKLEMNIILTTEISMFNEPQQLIQVLLDIMLFRIIHILLQPQDQVLLGIQSWRVILGSTTGLDIKNYIPIIIINPKENLLQALNKYINHLNAVEHHVGDYQDAVDFWE